MSRSAVVFVWLFAAARLAAGQTPYRVTWWDAASVGTAGALSLIPVALNLPRGQPPCAPCDPASVPGIDRAGLNNASASAATASGVLLGGVVGAAAFASLHGLDQGQRRGNAAVFARRVAGGRHFPTDVMGGAALGSGIGWLTATVHARGP